MAGTDRTAEARIALAVAASVLLHAAVLVLAPGGGGGRWRSAPPEQSALELVLLPLPVQPPVAEPTAEAREALKPPPMAVATPRTAAPTSVREPGPKLNDFGFSSFRAADHDLRERGYAEIASAAADVDAEQVASMSVQEFVDTGFADDWRGTLRALATVVVGADGAVEQVVVLDAEEPFVTYVASRLRAAAFEPARRDGEPVRGYAVVSVDFCPARSSCASVDSPGR